MHMPNTPCCNLEAASAPHKYLKQPISRFASPFARTSRSGKFSLNARPANVWRSPPALPPALPGPGATGPAGAAWGIEPGAADPSSLPVLDFVCQACMRVCVEEMIEVGVKVCGCAAASASAKYLLA